MSSSHPVGTPFPGSSDLFEEQVDMGSWARFQPSLATWLESSAPGTMVLVTAPAPVISQDQLSQGGGPLSWIRRRGALVASPDLPGIVLVRRSDGAEVDLPVTDARGRVLLDRSTCSLLTALGWSREQDLLRRVIASCDNAAEAITSTLIEVLRVPHPADLDHLLTQASCPDVEQGQLPVPQRASSRTLPAGSSATSTRT